MIKTFKESVVLFRRHQLFHLRPWKRHSLVLMVAGISYCAIGISYILAEPSVSREVALQYAINWFSLDVWGWWFVITGLATVLSSLWPPVTRVWGYELLTGLSVAWGLFYLSGCLFGESPWTNLSGAILWCIFGFLWWAISGLVDPTHPDPMMPIIVTVTGEVDG